MLIFKIVNMRFFQVYYTRLFTLMFIFVFLINRNIQICKASWQHPSTTQFSMPEECARECQNGELPKNCYYQFVLEYYTSNGFACNLCNRPVNDTNIISSCECIIGDGFEKTVICINRSIPGPSIQVCKGDYLIIDLKNNAEGLETSIHWHGIFQNGYQYYDGVPYLTQCPVLSADTFRYQFKVKNSGTHFYHSHISVHMIDGQYGSLVVRDAPNSNPHYNLYDEDRKEHVIVISDWMHELSMERYPGRYRTNRGQTPDNILVNGRGDWTNPVTGVSTNISLSTFIVQKGKKYRFRMINACSTVCLVEVTIEKHPMQIIATDGENVEPISTDKINMASGERYDFILHANQTSDYYWIHIRGLGECEKKEIYQLAILAYQGASMSSISLKPGYYFNSSGRIFNAPNSTECGINLCVEQLRKIYLPDEEEIPLNQKADKELILSFDFFNYSIQQNLLFNPQNKEDKRFFVAPTGSHLDSLINNVSYQDPPGPLISQHGYQFLCGDHNTPFNCTEPCSCTHVFHIPLGATVDVMIYDKRPLQDLNHPFHLHGYSFCVLYTGQFVNAINKDDIMMEDVNKEIKAHRKRLQKGSYKYCAPKDTIIVPNTGFIIMRFVANNPGWWFFHCHFTWHTATGMNVVLHVGNRNDLPPVPPGFPICYNWIPNLYD